MTDPEIAIAAAAKVCGIAKSKILSPSRVWQAVEARMLILLLLAKEGATDEAISWVLNRSRSTILNSRHNALNTMDVSHPFREKFITIKQIYEQEKSLRIS